VIEVRNLTKKYGNHLAVNNLSFTVEDNQVYGFLGPNGAGKSTTMNIMTGYIGLTDGEVIINGHNILTEPDKAKSCIGYLPEVPPLYKNMTVGEYLGFVAELKAIPKKDRLSEINKVVKNADISDVFNRLIGSLSKGYCQRVGLAQALLGSPKVLILDEPTVGLDPKQIIEIRTLIKSLAKDHTIILSSHILSEIQEVCDQVIIIHHGKLIAEGTPAELELMLGTTVTELILKADDDIAVKNLFSGIEGVTSVSCAPGEKIGELNIKLTVSSGADIQEEIYNVCVREHMPILMMKSGDFSLEQIFLELTEAESADTPAAHEEIVTETAEADTVEKEEE